MEDGNGVTTYSFDEMNRLEVVQYTGTRLLTYQYDAVGNQSVVVGTGSGRSTYSYDERGLLALVHNRYGERTTYQYDVVGRVTTMTHGNGTLAETDYDSAGRTTTVRNLKSDRSVISIFTYTYDNAGNRTAVAEASGDRVTYSYDNTYQLTREQRSGANAYDTTFSYDGAGNRLTKVDGGATTTYTYDAANQLTVEQAPSLRTTYTYDANGNTSVINAAGSLTTNTWDLENHITLVQLPGGGRNTMTYDGDGKRRRIQDSDGLRNLIWDLENILAETDSGNSTVAAYTLAPRGYGDVLAMRRSGATSFYHGVYPERSRRDALGSTDRLTDASQTELASYVRTAFGVPKATTGSHPNQLTFRGRVGYRWEPDTQQYDVRRRRLLSGRGDWLSVDPVRLEANWFAYARSNPVNQSDPAGLVTCGDLKAHLRAFKSYRVGTAERRTLITWFYKAVAHYLEQEGYPISSGNMYHWLQGGGDITMGPCPFLQDRVTAQRMQRIKQCLVALVSIPKCCQGVRDEHRWQTDTWPSTTDLAGSLGYFRLQGTLRCVVTRSATPSAPAVVGCDLAWKIWDRYDWTIGEWVPCLPGCDLGEPIQDAWAAEINDGPKEYNITVPEWHVTVSVPCPKSATATPATEICPPANLPFRPDDWPGPECWGGGGGR